MFLKMWRNQDLFSIIHDYQIEMERILTLKVRFFIVQMIEN